MKFSERFFKFPIRVYDSVSIKKVIEEEFLSTAPEEDGEEVKEPDWVRGFAKVPYWALNDLYYHESYSVGRKPAEVAERGFDMTSVFHKDFGEFDCMWKMGRFEEELDAFAERYEKYHEEVMARHAARAAI